MLLHGGSGWQRPAPHRNNKKSISICLEREERDILDHLRHSWSHESVFCSLLSAESGLGAASLCCAERQRNHLYNRETPPVHKWQYLRFYWTDFNKIGTIGKRRLSWIQRHHVCADWTKRSGWKWTSKLSEICCEFGSSSWEELCSSFLVSRIYTQWAELSQGTTQRGRREECQDCLKQDHLDNKTKECMHAQALGHSDQNHG